MIPTVLVQVNELGEVTVKANTKNVKVIATMGDGDYFELPVIKAVGELKRISCNVQIEQE